MVVTSGGELWFNSRKAAVTDGYTGIYEIPGLRIYQDYTGF